MVVLFHVISALSSILYTTYLLFSPVRRRFYLAYSLVGTTLLSGTYLIVSLHTNILQTCISGLIYLAVVSAGLAGAHYRLISIEAKNKIDQ